MTYKIILIRHKEGYTAKVPALPGCISEGNSETEAVENIKDAIREYLAAKKQLEEQGIKREPEADTPEEENHKGGKPVHRDVEKEGIVEV